MSGPPLRVGVDMHVLQGLNQGSRTYLESIYSLVPAIDPGSAYTFFFDAGKPIPGKWQQLGTVATFSGSKAKRQLWEARTHQRRLGLDAYHSQYIVPLASAAKDVVTIHDILCDTHPEYFSRAFVLRSRLFFRLAAKRAAKVLTVSEYTRRMLIERYGLAADRVVVTPNGVSPEEFAVSRESAVALVRQRYGLADYILTVGRLEPRKNHVGLLRAYALLRDRGADLPPLVLVGQRDFGFAAIFRTIAALRLEPAVRIIEDADRVDLINLYRAAHCFAYPSFAEGFGIPPLEALAAGLAVVCSGTSAMPEVCGAAALYADPSSPEAIADQLAKAIGDDAVRAALRAEASSVVARWSWSASARALVDALRSL